LEKEDKKTADEDESPKQIGAAVSDNQLFDTLDDLGDSSIPEATSKKDNFRGGQEKPSSAVFRQEEEEKMARSDSQNGA
jgi:hypothetical protein